MRIFKHRTDCDSHIFKRINDCQPFKLNLEDTHGDHPSDSQKREHLQSFFTIIERNLHRTYARKTFEGLMITLEKPALNKQVYHRKTALICNCILYSVKSQPGPVIEQS